MANETVSLLENDRPKIVVLQKFDVFDYNRENPFNYESQTKYYLIYSYIINNFELVDQTMDFLIYK